MAFINLLIIDYSFCKSKHHYYITSNFLYSCRGTSLTKMYNNNKDILIYDLLKIGQTGAISI